MPLRVHPPFLGRRRLRDTEIVNRLRRNDVRQLRDARSDRQRSHDSRGYGRRRGPGRRRGVRPRHRSRAEAHRRPAEAGDLITVSKSSRIYVLIIGVWAVCLGLAVPALVDKIITAARTGWYVVAPVMASSVFIGFFW